jgi:pimeloyl-ACP methyl ester carboxylesterase
MPDEQNPRDLTPHAARWDDVAGRRVRSLRAGPDDRDEPPVVLIPGLGALGYLIDTLHGCSAWTHAALLDVPGFGSDRPRPCAPVLDDVAALIAEWLRSVFDRPVVLFGHSTGAQAALHAAMAVPDRVAALVLAGPTFPPTLRLPGPLVRAFVRNSRYEPAGLMPVTWPYYRRGGPRSLVRYLRSAQHDRPEDLITSVACPVTVVRGQHDAFSPASWAADLAASAQNGQSVTVPGAHTFPYGRGGLTASIVAQAKRSCSTARREGKIRGVECRESHPWGVRGRPRAARGRLGALDALRLAFTAYRPARLRFFDA